jgi:hypothetical protein
VNKPRGPLSFSVCGPPTDFAAPTPTGGTHLSFALCTTALTSAHSDRWSQGDSDTLHWDPVVRSITDPAARTASTSRVKLLGNLGARATAAHPHVLRPRPHRRSPWPAFIRLNLVYQPPSAGCWTWFGAAAPAIHPDPRRSGFVWVCGSRLWSRGLRCSGRSPEWLAGDHIIPCRSRAGTRIRRRALTQILPPFSVSSRFLTLDLVLSLVDVAPSPIAYGLGQIRPLCREFDLRHQYRGQ